MQFTRVRLQSVLCVGKISFQVFWFLHIGVASLAFHIVSTPWYCPRVRGGFVCSDRAERCSRLRTLLNPKCRVRGDEACITTAGGFGGVGLVRLAGDFFADPFVLALT